MRVKIRIELKPTWTSIIYEEKIEDISFKPNYSSNNHSPQLAASLSSAPFVAIVVRRSFETVDGTTVFVSLVEYSRRSECRIPTSAHVESLPARTPQTDHRTSHMHRASCRISVASHTRLRYASMNRIQSPQLRMLLDMPPSSDWMTEAEHGLTRTNIDQWTRGEPDR